MAETIPPCINMIILGFVANISIGGLFIAGLVPAATLAVALAAVAIHFGARINPDDAFEKRKPMMHLIAGAVVGLVMILMIGKGVTSGIATSTEVSAFAVVYALVVGGLAFRELTWRSIVRLFVRSAACPGAFYSSLPPHRAYPSHWRFSRSPRTCPTRWWYWAAITGRRPSWQYRRC